MEGETCGCLGSEKQTIACVYSLLRGIIWRKVSYSFYQVFFFSTSMLTFESDQSRNLKQRG